MDIHIRLMRLSLKYRRGKCLLVINRNVYHELMLYLVSLSRTAESEPFLNTAVPKEFFSYVVYERLAQDLPKCWSLLAAWLCLI